MEKAIFGGGCFWCTEAVFRMLKGVSKVAPGYARAKGDHEPHSAAPTYLQVASGQTNYAEVIEIEYDPTQITFHDLLTVFFVSHDPTTVNKQGNDVGPQYRSAIFFTTPEQEAEAGKVIEEINNSNKMGAKVVTEVSPLEKFFEAEGNHHNYYEKN